MAAGFGSLRRFNETFRDLFQRPPSALRQKSTLRNEKEKDIVLRLRYRPPYDWESMLAFLRARAIPSLEVVDAGRYLRTVEIDGALGSIEVTHVADRHSLRVRIRFPEVRSLPAIVGRVRRFLAQVGVVEVEVADEQAVHERRPLDARPAAAEH